MKDPLENLLTTEEYTKGHKVGYREGLRVGKAEARNIRLERVLRRYESDLKAIRRATLAEVLTLRRLADNSLLAGERIRETGKAWGRRQSEITEKATE